MIVVSVNIFCYMWESHHAESSIRCSFTQKKIIENIAPYHLILKYELMDLNELNGFNG